MRDLRRTRDPLIVTAAVFALAAAGCSGWSPEPYPSPPATPLRPNFAGVIEKVAASSDGWLLTLSDGSTVDEPQSDSETRHLGSVPDHGYLHLVSTVSPRFVANLEPVPSYPGCWEAWPGQSSWRIAWDMGDSIPFSYSGLELPKAPDYHSDSPTQDVDGRQAWTTESQAVQPWTVCANSSGQIEWLRRTSQLGR
jgi:hypothetical protein